MVCSKEEPAMPGAYSADLRERVLLACEHGKLSRARIAKVFRVAESTVCRWLAANLAD